MKKKIRRKVLKFLILTVFFLSIYITLDNIKLYNSNDTFLEDMLLSSNYYTKYEKKRPIENIVNKIYQISLKEPITLIKKSLYNSYFEDEEYNIDELSKTTKYIEDPNPSKVLEPIVYIYNSHQLENYDSSNYEVYNITPNVMMASYMLKEKLNEYNIPTIAEDANITEYMNLNNWNYNYSYLASRYFIEEKIKEYPSIKYFIDLHRDSIKKNYSTININDKNYAKVLFVVGLEHQDASYNLEFAKTINNKILEKYPSLTRGVITKQGPGVNGIYNQDISHNSMLIEIGGYENKIEEVSNTIEVLSEVLKEIING